MSYREPALTPRVPFTPRDAKAARTAFNPSPGLVDKELKAVYEHLSKRRTCYSKINLHVEVASRMADILEEDGWEVELEGSDDWCKIEVRTPPPRRTRLGRVR